MNYYEHHLGDFARDTGHLSALEHGIYRLLLDWYYATEKPIPDAQAERLARSPRKAVLPVLEEFFTLDGLVWRHKRVEAEIARYRDKSEKASRSASARWTNSERNANALPTQCEGNAHQTPVTSNQSPEKQKQKPPSATPTAAPFVPPSWVPAEAWAGFEAMRRRERHPLTHRAAALIVSALDRLRAEGHDPGEVLDQSTRNGWRDVFQIRTAALGPRAGPTAKPKTVAAYDAIGAKIDELSTVVPGRDRPRIAGPDPAQP